MSGSGMVAAASEPRRSAEQERADVLAFLRRRRDNAATLEKQKAGMDDFAGDRRRQLDVLIEKIEQGFHEDVAAVEAHIVEGLAD